MHNPTRTSTWWIWLNIAVIVYSAVLALSPLASLLPFRIGFGFIIGPVYFYALIRQARKAGVADVPLSQVPSKIRAGHRLP